MGLTTTGPRSPYAIYEAPAPIGAPSIDIDPFSAEVLAEPYAAHSRLREAGPFVWLSAYAVGRCRPLCRG